MAPWLAAGRVVARTAKVAMSAVKSSLSSMAAWSTKYICPSSSTSTGASAGERSLKYSTSELHTNNDDAVSSSLRPSTSQTLDEKQSFFLI
jgi:hypothetical protein